MEVNLSELTAALARRMAAIVPDGFHVEAGDGMLWYSADDGRFPGQLGNHQVGRAGTYVRDNFNINTRSKADEESVAAVAAQALGELQDYVDQATHEPWPAEHRPPRAYAQVRERVLYMWYGGPDITSGAVLACEPIPLADLEQQP